MEIEHISDRDKQTTTYIVSDELPSRDFCLPETDRYTQKEYGFIAIQISYK